jgi:hypothetical protein
MTTTFKTFASVMALGIAALSGPLAAAPYHVDLGLAFQDAATGEGQIITVKDSREDRADDRDDRRDDRNDDRDDRRDDRDDDRDDRDDDRDDRHDDRDDDSGRGYDDDESDDSYDDSGNDGWDDSGNDGWDDSGNDGWDDSGNDGWDDSGSGRDEPRIPGGSGCDDPDDILEHPECSAPQRSRFSLGFN